MTLEEIRELIKVVTETGVAELEVQRGDNRVRIRRVLRPQLQTFAVPAGPGQAAVGQTPELAISATATGSASAGAATAPDPITDPSLITIKSPIVGTFYESPSPGSPNFVKLGDTVRPGDVLCIIESMKLMNEIEAEIAGTVVTKFVNNAQPVEYGEALFAIRPL